MRLVHRYRWWGFQFDLRVFRRRSCSITSFRAGGLLLHHDPPRVPSNRLVYGHDGGLLAIDPGGTA